MRGPVTPDGYLAPHPEIEGKLAMVFDTRELGKIATHALYEGDPNMVLLGRSVEGQVGGDIVAIEGGVTHNGSTLEQATQLYVGYDMVCYTGLACAMKADMQTIATQTKKGEVAMFEGERLPVGRFLDTSRLESIDPEEVERYRTQGLIYFGSGQEQPVYRMVDGVGPHVKLSYDEYELLEEDFETTEERLTLLQQGRTRIATEAPVKTHHPDDPIPSFLLGGISVSALPFFWQIKPRINDHLQQLTSANLFDANRTMGVGEHLPSYDRHRQVELVLNYDPNSNEPAPTFGNTWIPLEFFRMKLKEDRDRFEGPWHSSKKEDLVYRHLNGTTPLEALGLANPDRQAAMLSELDDTTDAVVWTRKGVQRIPSSSTEARKIKRINRALHRRGDGLPKGMRNPKVAAQAMNELGAAGDRTSTVLAKELNLSDVPTIIHNGARAIYMKRYWAARNDIEHGPVDLAEHTILTDFARKGIGIAQGKGNNYRELHVSGNWVKPKVPKLVQRVQFSAGIFGGNRDEFHGLYLPSISRLVGSLSDHFGPDKVMVLHGGGGGVMLAAHHAALIHSALSFAIAIDKEHDIADTVKLEAHGYIQKLISTILSRQDTLEAMSYFTYTVDGGIGAQVEIDIASLMRKLAFNIPTPIYIVSEQGLYNPTREQYANFAKHEVSRADGRSANVKGSPTALRRIMPKLMRFYGNMDDAIGDTMEFIADPPKQWAEMKIRKPQVDSMFANKQQILELHGMTLPMWLEEARKDYTGTRKAIA